MINKFLDFLNEGRYDGAILNITREFINNFKEKFGVYYKFTTMYEHDDYNPVELVIVAKPSKKIKFDFDIQAQSTIELINIGIIYNPSYFPFSYNKLIAEIKNTLRHEFTHIKQDEVEQNDMVDKDEDIYTNKQPKNDYNDKELDVYLFHPDEIEAFVNGFYKESKTRKQTFTNTIDAWLSTNYQYFQDKSNVLKIRKVWINDFKKRYGNKYI